MQKKISEDGIFPAKICNVQKTSFIEYTTQSTKLENKSLFLYPMIQVLKLINTSSVDF